ncbi:MAG: hypothetical protein FCO83_02390 [Spiroplasma sp. WSS]|nr:MAG: hypothetical protein FCO83_02390 [Spiroplasma sp. WSS]
MNVKENRKELYLKYLLPSKLIKLSGLEFQKFLGDILKAKYGSDFVLPWKYGSHGDYKNDGYVKSDGTYFAIYGPEKADLNVNSVNKKIESDLKGLIEKIKEGKWKSPLKEFIFVINDKLNENLPSPICSKVNSLEFDYKLKITLWTQREIKNIFEQLNVNEMKKILEAPYLDNNFDIDLSATIISEIIDNLVKLPKLEEKINEPLDFKKKIKFNNLDFNKTAYLNIAYLSLTKLENIMRDLDQFSTEEIGKKIIILYKESQKKFEDSNDQFEYIFQKFYICKNNWNNLKLKQVEDAKWVIMAKYFENCSILKSR